MKLSQVFSGDYLKASDLQGRDATVVIAEVKVKEFDDGNKLLISFQGAKKSLVANKTNSNRIAMLYGDETADWIGKEVTLYVDIVDFQGKPTEAIRIKPPGKPQAMTQTGVRPGPRPDLMKQTGEPRNDMDDEVPF